MKYVSMDILKVLGRLRVAAGCIILGSVLSGCSLFSDSPPPTAGKDPFGYDPLAGQATPPAQMAPETATSLGGAGTAAPAAATTIVTNAMRIGDTIIVRYSDTVNELKPDQDTIKPDGTITLMWNQTFVAAGKTPAELGPEIRARYVPKYYKELTATVTPADRFFVVSGEVKMANRYIYTGHMTVLEAIATAGGFTDFSKKSGVQVTRGLDKTKLKVNCKEAVLHPELNIEIVPGDIVHVPKRFLWD